MQWELDKILGDRPPSRWSFETDFPNLLDGFVGAVMNETLRLFSVLPFHPKTTREAPIRLTLDEREYVVPSDTLILMNTSATHRNPKFWPSAVPKSGDGPPYPVSSFNPRQWMRNSSAEDRNASPFSPKPGSWIPFSEGHRACVGKRFAQAEFCAVMASIFKFYSVELVIGNGTVNKKETKRSQWERARLVAEKELSDRVGFLMSLKMSGTIPIRFVKRGQEQKLD